MQHAATGRHPLHVAGADVAAGAGGIAMIHLALIDDGDGLETAVRMHAHATLARRRLECAGPA
jgi:hypothetical protein